MNLFLRPLEDVNDVTWSIIWCLIILLGGVAYYIYTIMSLAYEELNEDQKGTTVPDHCTDSDVIDDNSSDTDHTEQ